MCQRYSNPLLHFTYNFLLYGKVLGELNVLILSPFRAFQAHTDKMRSKLAGEMKQKVDDEDDRLARAVAETDDKIAKEERAKREKEMLIRKSIHEHRMNTVSVEIYNTVNGII